MTINFFSPSLFSISTFTGFLVSLSIYNKDKIIIKNKQLDDVVELPNVGDNKLYLFIGDFVQDFMQKDSINIKDSDEQLILEKDISQDF